MTSDSSILRYFLYAETPSDAEPDFLNVEAIPLRSGAHDWTIRPHSHPNHLQMLWVTQGGGRIRLDDTVLEMPPPSLVVIPPGTVHDISFRSDTDGVVITVARAYLLSATAEDDRVVEATATSRVLPLVPGREEAAHLGRIFDDLLREYSWSGPGRRMAIKGHLLTLLVGLLRLAQNAKAPESGGAPRRDAQIVDGFRADIEAHFRTDKRLSSYIRRLGVSSSRLHMACRSVTGESPAALLHERIIIEAKRLLIFSGNSVSEIAHRLGYDDAAYFSRFFAQRTGLGPRQFRATQTATTDRRDPKGP
jgi:AraC family transcriptional activator of pobA